ncbi:GNAT family N-acetyltransferase [Clostridium tagluense]|uniref:GNAT family N-acetyltransferase n=1 Tax=Clostridium tagluense TaxID=360422 RepID=UPI001C6E95E5|nr:GNAT family N-acetyltransferase [Clostridium tagluense]MBW9157781.1 GNAT family N-acetyltransferase [Clostridium tagluense]WLC63758.1 GNAT family N-acetyltransferase [Clostridium tagluense]
MENKFERTTINDVEALIDVRNQCFYADYVKYGECPGYNHSKESMTNAILNRIVYKIICNNQIIGNISVRDNYDNTYYLGCLCVIPEYENKGIGQEAIRFIESEFPNATVWTLETPSDKKRNHYFYKKAGYTIIEEYIDGSVKLVLFEKKMNT